MRIDEITDEFHSCVAGAIVDDEDFDGEGLGGYPGIEDIEGLAQTAFFVECRDDYREFRQGESLDYQRLVPHMDLA